MYTHLYISHSDAEKLFKAFARKPLGARESGSVTRATLDAHFAEFGVTYLSRLGTEMSMERRTDPPQFVLKFREYLARMPRPLIEMEIKVIRAEIVRFNSAPTSARAGFYENPKVGFQATVERIYPTQHQDFKRSVPLYAQNITVCGPTLEAVQESNTKLCTGAWNRFLVNAFE